MRRKPLRSPFRRRNGDKPFNRCNKRSGVIDQRLVEGAQVSSPFFSQLRMNDGGDDDDDDDKQQLRGLGLDTGVGGGEGSGFWGEDMQLDAFDLQLLAWTDRAMDNGRDIMRDNRPPKQVLRFFSGPDSHITPHVGIASSSSELDVGSSPSTRFQQGRTKRNMMTVGPPSGMELSSQTERSPSSHLDVEEMAAKAGQSQCLQPTTTLMTPFQNMPMSIRGIVLVSVHELPDSYRSIFSFPVFNAVQSKCFRAIYHQNDNIVLASPTGSGKTVIMELAICRLLSSLKDERFKVVYQAPTKSLCSERFRDWSKKFMTLGLQCAVLTGDTDQSQLRSVQSAQIIITTPEKWDSMTRKWKDHTRLMQLVKLFLIDEVHILKETRGATLEAVVSRMKFLGSSVRFVALSATVPNSEDIAVWLGKDATNQHMPAHREHFGEEFRPVKLQKFVYGYQSNGNDFAFDKMCSGKLPGVIGTHSCRKPIMIFCCTRNSSVATAKELARLWSMTNPPARLWRGPSKHLEVHNIDLKSTIVAGVAFHHAGLDPVDRHTVENGYLQGDVNIICCTSTLAVGVNMPCHLVIIKNTVGWQDGGCKEYSDLEMMQMLGRAGRPQFDDSAVAVILTRKERVKHYEKLVSESESLESCLHLNLIDHLNAEIGLGTVTDVESAVRWLAGTFLFVRLTRNPRHYKLKEGASRNDENEMLRQICEKDINMLQECGLVTTEQLRSTHFGDAMARYYVRFETMKNLLSLKPKATVLQILSKITEADEFRDLRLKSGEKSVYKEINRANGIRFPVKVDIALPAHKTSLLIQSELGGVDFPDGDQFQKHKFPFQQDKGFVFTHINRLIRCVIDCQISLEDSVAVRNALELARSFGAKVWDNSPWQMKQLDQIGTVAVRKIAAAGITSIEALESTEAYQIDMTLSKNPPFGSKLLARAAEFPKLRISVKMMGKDRKSTSFVKFRFKAELAFMNEKVPVFFQRRAVYVCFLAETSDGRMIDFRRLNASKLQNSHEILLSADLQSAEEYIICYAMCDDIAGTMRSAELKPGLSASLFPAPSGKTDSEPKEEPRVSVTRPCGNELLQNGESSNQPIDIDDLLDGMDVEDILEADLDVEEKEIDWPAVIAESSPQHKPRQQARKNHKPEKKKELAPEVEEEPVRLENGKWACNHKCKDKKSCKHLCCRDGLEKPPKVNKKQTVNGNQKKHESNQLKLSPSIAKKGALSATSSTEIPGREDKRDKINTGSTQVPSKKPNLESKLMEVESPDPLVVSSGIKRMQSSSDYGGNDLDDLPSPSLLLNGNVSIETDNANREKGNAREDERIDKSVFDWDDWIEIDDPVEPPTPKKNDTNELQQINLMHQYPSMLIPSGQEIGPDIRALCSFHDVKHYQPSKRTVPFVDENKQSLKRSKTNTQCESFPLSHRQGEIVLVERNGTNPTPGINKPSSSPKDWEDIDPLLLDEFKDIVNFF